MLICIENDCSICGQYKGTYMGVEVGRCAPFAKRGTKKLSKSQLFNPPNTPLHLFKHGFNENEAQDVNSHQ